MSQSAAILRKDPLSGALETLGLSSGEIALYRLCLEQGPQPLSRLASKLKIARPNIYKLVHGLAEHGLAKRPEKNSTKRFSVFSPSRIAELLEQKRTKELGVQNQLLSSLPTLLAKYKRGDLPSGVKIFQGEQQYMGIFYGILDEANDRCDYCGSVEDFLKLISLPEQVRWLNERIRRGLPARTLTLESPTARRISAEDTLYLRQTRLLPSNIIPFQTSFHLYADKVIFWQPESMLAICIEDDLIFEMMRSIFEMLWGLSRVP